MIVILFIKAIVTTQYFTMDTTYIAVLLILFREKKIAN